MPDEPDGAFDWPHAVGGESHARRWRLARGIHDTEMRSGDKLDELLEAYLAQNDEISRLRGLLEAADFIIDYARLSLAGPYWDKRLAAYDSLKDDKLKGE